MSVKDENPDDYFRILNAGDSLVMGAFPGKPDMIVGNLEKSESSKMSMRCEMCSAFVWLSDGYTMHLKYPDVPVICLGCAVMISEAQKNA